MAKTEKEAEAGVALTRLLFGLGALTGLANKEEAKVIAGLVALSNQEKTTTKEWEEWRTEAREVFRKDKKC